MRVHLHFGLGRGQQLLAHAGGGLAELQERPGCVSHKGGVGVHVDIRASADLGKAVLMIVKEKG